MIDLICKMPLYVFVPLFIVLCLGLVVCVGMLMESIDKDERERQAKKPTKGA